MVSCIQINFGYNPSAFGRTKHYEIFHLRWNTWEIMHLKCHEEKFFRGYVLAWFNFVLEKLFKMLLVCQCFPSCPRALLGILNSFFATLLFSLKISLFDERWASLQTQQTIYDIWPDHTSIYRHWQLLISQLYSWHIVEESVASCPLYHVCKRKSFSSNPGTQIPLKRSKNLKVFC